MVVARTLKLGAHAQTMNVAGRFRYATLPGIADFYRWDVVQSIGAGLKVRKGRSQTLPVQRVVISRPWIQRNPQTLRSVLKFLVPNPLFLCSCAH